VADGASRVDLPRQWRSRPKIFVGPNFLTLSGEQYFAWDIASQKHKMRRYARNLARWLQLWA